MKETFDYPQDNPTLSLYESQINFPLKKLIMVKETGEKGQLPNYFW